MEKIKHWIIKKLGGVIWEELDIPIHIKQDLMNYWTNKALDKHCVDILNNGLAPTPKKDN